MARYVYAYTRLHRAQAAIAEQQARDEILRPLISYSADHLTRWIVSGTDCMPSSAPQSVRCTR